MGGRGPIPDEEFARRFREALEGAGLSQSAAAMQLGWGRSRINEYATGRRIPGLPIAIWMIAELDLDPTILMPELFSGPGEGEDRAGSPPRADRGSPPPRP